MTWDAIGAIAELLGAIGVIGSLVYLATQLKASTQASHIEAKFRLTDAWQILVTCLSTTPSSMTLCCGAAGIPNHCPEKNILYSRICVRKPCGISQALTSCTTRNPSRGMTGMNLQSLPITGPKVKGSITGGERLGARVSQGTSRRIWRIS